MPEGLRRGTRSDLENRGRFRLHPSVSGDLVIVRSGPQEGNMLCREDEILVSSSTPMQAL